MDYLIWSVDMPDGYCVCLGMDGFEESYKIMYAQPVAEHYDGEAFFEMSPDFTKDIALADNVKNTGYILVSDALKKVLEEMVTNRVEYVPVRIINHKGRVASEDYFVVNPLDLCDAIDFEQSDVEWNSIDPNVLSDCYELVLHEDRIPSDYTLFRLKHFPTEVLLRRDVVERLEAEGFTGLRFIEVEDFDGF